MKLWADANEAHLAGKSVKAKVSELAGGINSKVTSRGIRAVNAMRNAQLNVLKGQRSGRVYRKPFTNKSVYRASAPGEAPARRAGNLRLHWNGQVKSGSVSGGGTAIVAELESQEPYAAYLEYGTARMAARPFVEKIKEEAWPEINKIYREPYA